MNTEKPIRRNKGQITCFFCRTGISPKNGDWFTSLKSDHRQIFSCRPCERQMKGDYKPVNLARRMTNE